MSRRVTAARHRLRMCFTAVARSSRRGSISSFNEKYGSTVRRPSFQEATWPGSSRRTPAMGTSSPGTKENVRYLWSAGASRRTGSSGTARSCLSSLAK
ncbi:MAG: hypothetical protein DMF78_04605 [Acidobacteria bacterium]|nr:MAG: hypothetical protein DMF78_04605 [Acidobacteriota bacterium]